jgi:hypothetical protein
MCTPSALPQHPGSPRVWYSEDTVSSSSAFRGMKINSFFILCICRSHRRKNCRWTSWSILVFVWTTIGLPEVPKTCKHPSTRSCKDEHFLFFFPLLAHCFRVCLNLGMICRFRLVLCCVTFGVTIPANWRFSFSSASHQDCFCILC